jgi:Tfp pilus assembly protein PilO
MTGANRIFQEKRRLIVPLAIVAAVNLGVLALVVYPLSMRVGNSERRSQSAGQQLAAATADFRAARATLEGRQRTDVQLAKFYEKVLPQDQAAARRITYLKLAQLAREGNLDYEQRAILQEHKKGSTLSTLVLKMALEGDYRDIRAFIHTLETTPDFIVVRNVGLTKPTDKKKQGQLTVSLTLATYYRATDAELEVDANDSER